MTFHIEGILPSPDSFLQQLFQEIKESGADLSKYTIDHICYRTETKEDYNKLKNQLLPHGELLTEKPIGGRPIATFRLQKPFIFKHHKIELLEIPAPKPGRFYPEGYEHIEMVIDREFSDFMALYQQLEFDTRAIGKEVNPEVRVKFPSGSVKFHHHPLDFIISFER